MWAQVAHVGIERPSLVTNRVRLRNASHLRAKELCGVAVHVGQQIKAVLEAHTPRISVTAFAESIGRSRKNVYQIFEAHSLDSALLRTIGKALDHDFSQYASHKPSDAQQKDDKPTILAEPSIEYTKRDALVLQLMEEVMKLSNTVPALVQSNSELWAKYQKVMEERDMLQNELKKLRHLRTG